MLAVGLTAARPTPAAAELQEVKCLLPPYEQIEVRIAVIVKPGASSGELNRATVSGGGTPRAVGASHPITVGHTDRFGVEDFQFIPENAGGTTATQAGSHPFQQTTVITLNSQQPDPEGRARPVELPKDVVAETPVGFLGNPTPFEQCTDAQFGKYLPAPGGTVINECPAASAVGVATLTFVLPSNLTTKIESSTVPIFNMTPRYGEPARFGFKAEGVVAAYLDPSVRSGSDYGLTISSTNITQASSLLGVQLTLWGVPGDPAHDASRGWECLRGFGSCPPSSGPTPPSFLLMPTACGPFQATIGGDSWAAFGHPAQQADPLTYLLPEAVDGCNRLGFEPLLSAEPTSDAATSPTGLNFDLDFDDEGLRSAGGTAQSQMKKAVVTLPQGFTTNPSVAEGLQACSLHEYEAASIEAGTGCTPESKVGEVEIESPLVKPSQILKGGLYVAKQGENPSKDAQHPNGNLLTLYLIAREPEIGVIIKQALKVTADPVTGQLTTEVDNAPQLPFSRFHLAFRSGQRSPLITPPACGTYTVNADLYPWSNPSVPVPRESSFQITSGPEGQPCPSGGVPPFHPNLLAGSENPTAGAYSPFYTEITRKDSEQEITRFSIKLPPGVIGKLAGVSSCSDAAIAAAKAREKEGGGQEELNNPSCPANSEIGHSNVGSGVGNVLAYAPGKLYLAGPYHGSNLSIVSITAAKVGPFDLGTVVVRFALKIDPETAEVSVDGATSDPIPHIVDGIPVHLRDIQAFVDRPNFTLNPTSCKKTSTASTVLGSGLNFASEADDQPVTITSPFQVGSCASLGFKPKLALSLKGGTKRGDTPRFKAVVTYPKGGAYSNIASAQVTLPHSEFLDNAHIKTVCTRVQFKEGTVPGEKCPAGSVYGFAKAITPLLDEPVEGPVYLRSSSHQLPDLVAALHNKQVDFALDGHVEGVKGGIRNTFEAVPDAPVTKFTLEMQGGKKGLLENSTNLCTRPHRATAVFEGHNGKVENFRPLLAVSCPKKHKRGKRHHNRASLRRLRRAG
ncbi:MAG TPA: hypothetical protein VJ257_04865 [Solirubrobacterales bacterium]|nr:hypothetical protein [Solirubrobacterales bacterium]